MCVPGIIVLFWFGCQNPGDPGEIGMSMGAYRDRMLVAKAPGEAPRDRERPVAKPVAWQGQLPERTSLVTQPPTSQPSPAEVLAQLPDPDEAPANLKQRLEALRSAPRPDPRVVRNYESVVQDELVELKAIHKPNQIRLSLAECVQRALEHNYSIRYEAYNPAISQTQLVEAEAAFDAEFFMSGSWDNRDQATVSAIVPGQSDTRQYGAGFRTLLPTGMRVSTAVSQQRNSSNISPEFQTINPTYGTNFTVNITQPLLRGFGLEYNRATINIRKAERDIAHEKFLQTVRDRLLDVENAYWGLMLARRTAAVVAETVAQNKTTYQNMLERLTHDATEVEVANAKTQWLQQQVNYQEAVRAIRDAEDVLKNLLNDPSLLLSGDLEIIPIDTPFVAALALDQLAAVRTALDERNEIRQARRAIDITRIGTMAAKNQTMPQLDLTFAYEVEGLAKAGDDSFNDMTHNNFISYTLKAEFSYPLGNRARRAAYQRAQLQESQAIVALHQTTDGVVQEVNSAVRALMVRYAQIPPSLDAVNTAEIGLRALQARTQKIDPTYLDSELNAVVRLTQARQTLLTVIRDYNVAIVALEKAKGTLLHYNNIVVTDAPPER